MARIQPFCGVRFNTADITRLICPPYDVISDNEKKRLKKLSANNFVRIELPDETAGTNKYQQANAVFIALRAKGVLCKDADPALYFYEQVFKDHGRRMVRRGFFAALELENPQGGAVKPHERTLSKPKEDRLKLIRSVRANLSPIFGLFHDKNLAVVNLCARLAKTVCDARAKDEEGTIHKVWKVTDPRTIAVVVKTLAPQKVFIADGHHRYETAWNYFQEQKKKDKKYSPASAYGKVMIFLCPMEDAGLSVWPTHRVVVPPAELEARIEKYFTVLPASAFKKLSHSSPQPLLVYLDGAYRTLAIKNKRCLKTMMPGKCAAYRQLGVSILHALLLADVAPESITYVKNDVDAVALARSRSCMAVMVPSTPIEAIKDIALAGQTMPQKSTYFYPKVASGIVVHAFR
ncbi:MAG: DUF1015 domain-containing protein [Elusimicrobia bacterium]|nr:DUF1015 domain-containing protein [Elusimicrobiota bacterium]